MKKYGKLIALGVFSLVCVGYFFITTAVSGDDAPEYTIETRSGDAAYIEKMVLSGGSSSEDAFYWEPIEISLDGTKGQKDYSLKEQLDSVLMMDTYIQKMYREHSDFLRNKTWSSSSYFENEEEVIYADVYIKDYTTFEEFELAVLDKQMNDQEEYHIEIPDHDKYDSLYIDEVQKMNDELILFTTNYMKGKTDLYSPITEVHAYRVDLEKQVVLEDTVVQPETDKTADYSTGKLNRKEAVPERFVVFESLPTTQSEEEVVIDPETISVLAYDVAANEVKTLSVPNELKELPSYEAAIVQDSYIYYTVIEENGFNTSRFNIETDTVDQTQLIELPSEVMVNFSEDQSGGVLTHIDGNTVYYINTVEYSPDQNISIVAADLKTGQVLYDGTVENGEDMGETFKDNTLSINSMSFK